MNTFENNNLIQENKQLVQENRILKHTIFTNKVNEQTEITKLNIKIQQLENENAELKRHNSFLRLIVKC